MKNLVSLVPGFAKPMLRPLYHTITSSRPYRMLWRLFPNLPLPTIQNSDDLLDYWKHRRLHKVRQYVEELPYHETKAQIWGQFLLEKLQRYATPKARILEIGCGIGLNLNYLFQANFKSLEGVEINKQDVQILKQAYPEMAQNIKIHNTPIEEVIRDFKDRQFDMVLAISVLRLIHPDNEWIFSEMVRITNYLITGENESLDASLCYPRNYKKVFEALGMIQVEGFNSGDIGFSSGRKGSIRIFKKRP